MRKRKLRTFLIVGVLFFLPACGIPRMFPWSEGSQYDLTSNSITFYFDFLYQTDEGVQSWPTLEPSPNTPVFRIYYYIDPGLSDPSISNIGSSLRSRFRSRYGSSFPPYFDEGDPVATVTVTDRGNNDETIEVSAYEVTVVPADGGDPVAISRLFQGMDYFVSSGGSSYTADYSFSVPDSTSYYIEMTYNGQTYNLARMNGDQFTSDPDAYFNPVGRGEAEFLPEDRSVMVSPTVHLFGAVSFAFEGYTTRQTVLLDDIILI